MVFITPPDDAKAVSRRNKFIWLLVGSWLAAAFVSVAQSDFADASAASARGDYDTAFKEMKPLAEQGHATAQFNLGVMYDNGQGVPQDYVLAHVWFELAASQGDEGAIKNRDLAAKLMTSDQIAEAQKLARESKPSE